LELCEGYLVLGTRLLAGDDRFEQAWNFGPWPGGELSVSDLTTGLTAAMKRPDHRVSVSPSPLRETQMLRLDISKTVSKLGWRPRLPVREALNWTAEWYGEVGRDRHKALDCTLRQIDAFEALIKQPGVTQSS
jgi:CDP-glucose 4,6-dehydratase